jgi:4-hydroxybenzoate polyprenyltransferase
LALVTSIVVGSVWPGAFAIALAAAIVAYNARLKSTWFGPWAMGSCRGLNIAMGMSAAAGTLPSVWLVPLGATTYVAGITLFARDEAAVPRRDRLTLAMLVSLIGLVTFALARSQMEPFADFYPTAAGWWLIWLVIALFASRRFVVAIVQPRTAHVISAVKHALLSLVLIDACLALGVGGPYYALAVLSLLAPATLCSQFIRMT